MPTYSLHFSHHEQAERFIAERDIPTVPVDLQNVTLFRLLPGQTVDMQFDSNATFDQVLKLATHVSFSLEYGVASFDPFCTLRQQARNAATAVVVDQQLRRLLPRDELLNIAASARPGGRPQTSMPDTQAHTFYRAFCLIRMALAAPSLAPEAEEHIRSTVLAQVELDRETECWTARLAPADVELLTELAMEVVNDAI